MIQAHGGAPGGVEVELMLLGVGFIAAAYFFRPSQVGNVRTTVLTLIIGIALVIGSIVLPRMTTDDHPSGERHPGTQTLSAER